MTENMTAWITDDVISQSPRVVKTRAKIERAKLAEWSADEPLSSLAFGGRGEVGFERTYTIERRERPWFDRPVGAIIMRRGSPKTDPLLAAYLAVKIGTTTTFEGLVKFADPNTISLWHNGSLIGGIVETPLKAEKTASLWDRIFHGRRKWQVIAGKECCGDVAMQNSPRLFKEQLYFRLKSGLQLPISVSRRANMACGGGISTAPFQGLLGAMLGSKDSRRKQGDMIIPLNTPREFQSAKHPETERLHFLLNIAFRAHYMRFDFY